MKPWLDNTLAPNGKTVAENFTSWYGDGVLRDDTGGPLLLFRGQRKSPRDDGFTTTNGRATPSFTDDPEVANVYARQLEKIECGAGSTVLPVFISMKKPYDIRHHGEQVTLDDVIMSFDKVNLSEEFVDDGVGYQDLADAIRGFDSVIYKNLARYSIDASDGKGYRIRDFSELAERIEELGWEGADEDIYNLLYEVKFDAYLLADSKNFTRLLKRNGFDGVVHLDVFDVGLQHYEGDKTKIEDGFDADAVIVAYRPFNQEQIKSAIGNSGLFQQDSRSLCDKEAADALEAGAKALEEVRLESRRQLAGAHL